jgi:uncharacterized protein (TIGR01777 family)
MTIVITGATGFIGRHLIARLKREGHAVRALGRRDPRTDDVEFVEWDSAREPPPAALADADALVHLAGEPVAQRWSDEAKRRIHDSRVHGTRNLVNALSKLQSRPSTLIAGSAIGYYGDRGDEVLTEASGPGSDFLARTCVEWEHESVRAGDLGLRVAIIRTGLVLGSDGGALKRMLPPFRAGVGGPVGSGRQWTSWIHIEDIAGLIVFSLSGRDVYGPVNGASPNPLRNSEFARELGAVLHRPAFLPVPAFGLKLIFGEMANVLLSSQRVTPEAASRAGYVFKYPELRGALQQILT